MSARPRTLFRVVCPGLVALLLLGCGESAAPPSKPAAEKPKVEAELAYTTLSGAEDEALKIRSEPILTRKVQEQLKLTGWIMAPQGKEVTLTAPVGGYVREPAAKDGAAPVAGLPVAKGKVLFVIDPVPTPLEKVQLATLERGLKAELTKAQKSVKVRRDLLETVERLYKKGLKQKQEVDQTRLDVQHAEEDESAARAKLDLLGWEPVAVAAPLTGTALAVNVSPGQYVPPAAPLATVADLTELWVRVPVPEHDLPYLDLSDRKRPVLVTLRSGPEADVVGTGPATRVPRLYDATLVAEVPLVDPARHTADLLYKLSPRPRAVAGKPPPPTFFAKDQMVTVFVPLGRQRTESLVPYDAVVFDAHGGAWVYIDLTPKKGEVTRYQRRRVELGPTVPIDLPSRPTRDSSQTRASPRFDTRVVIRPAAGPGEYVVVAGAALLYSREFHKTPVRR